MKEIIDLYNQNRKFLIGNDSVWLSNIREKLISEISKEGLPSKKKEIWKYSDLLNINNIKYRINKSNINAKKINTLNQIDVINGEYFISNQLKKSNKILLTDLKESINNFENYFSFNKNFFKKDFTIDLNTLFLSSGLTISIKENEKFYLVVNYENISDETTNYIRNLIKVEKNAKLIFIENFGNTNSKNNYYNIFNNFWLDKGANLEHIIIQNLEMSSNLIYSSLLYCYENSKFNQLSFQKGSQSVKFQHNSNLMEKESSANHYGIYFAKEKQFIDNKTSVIHHQNNCQSNQIYKGILTDESKCTYLSNTLVKPEAQKTNGYQLSRGMLLSEECKLNTKPELKIYADDVKCSHGSTIGALDKNQLYYLQTRGLSFKKSRNLLIKAFYKDILEEFIDEEIKFKIEKLIDEWLILYEN